MTQARNDSDERIPVIAVLGPTASGKTALTVRLALRCNAEIISCDSMQIYKGMHIATAKPTAEEVAQVPHHLIDFLPADADFSAAEYVTLADKAARDIFSRNKNIILCGGTGLYADAFLSGMRFAEVQGAAEKREELICYYNENGAEALLRRLSLLDPEAAASVDPANIKRMIRAIEICECTGSTLHDYKRANLAGESPYRVLRFVLDFKDREALYTRINDRVEEMVRAGLEEEAREYASVSAAGTAAQAIGYKELAPYFAGEIGFRDAIDHLKRATRHYAKRQQTWFKRDPEAVHLYVDAEDCFDKAMCYCRDFLKG